MGTGTYKVSVQGPRSGKEISAPPVEATNDDRAKIEAGKRITEYEDIFDPQGKVVITRPNGTKIDPITVEEMVKKSKTSDLK